MDISVDALSNRAMSSYLISIGTSLALESLQMGPNKPYDPDRPIPNKIDINNYNSFYINLLTLFRNIVGAVDNKQVDSLMPGDIVLTLEQEVNTIKEIISSLSHGKTKTVFYVSKYKNLEQKFPFASIRKDNTEKQKQYTSIMQQVINEFINRQDKNSIDFYECELEPINKDKSLILTNYAFDLLYSNKFERLDLLESHTGVLKTKSQFYTKLLNGKELVRIPFNKMSIQVFGDKETFIPMPMKVKNEILALSEKYQWTQVTQKDRLFYCFNTLKDTNLANMLKSMI